MAAPITNATVGVSLDLSRAERQIRQFESRAINLNFNASRPLGRLTGDVAEFEKSMSAANARVLAFGAAAAVIGGVSTAMHAMVTESIAVEKALTNINTTLGASQSQLSRFEDSLFGIARNTESTFANVAKAAQEFSHQGLSLNEVLRRTGDAMSIVRTSGLPLEEVVKSLTSTVNAFNQEALTTTQVADRFTAVSTRFGVSVRDLSGAFAGVGPAAQQVGVSFNDLIGIITRTQQVSGKAGTEIGEALRTIFTRISQQDTLKGLNDIGVAVKTVQGNTLPAIEILSRLSGTLDRLSDSQREQVAELLGGVRQVSLLKVALGDLNAQYSIHKSVVDAANNSTGEAARRQGELNKSISAQANEALANLQKLAAGAGNLVFGPVIKNLLGAVNDSSKAFDGDSIGKKVGEGILRGIGDVLAGPGLVAGGVLAARLLKGFADFATKAAANVLEIGKASEKELQLQTGINALLQQTPGLYASILSEARSITEQEEITLGVIRQQAEAQAARARVVANVSSGLAGRGVRFDAGRGGFTGAAEALEEEAGLAGGFIPNLVNAASRRAEINAASREGYSVQPSQVRSMTAKIDGKTTNVVYNSRERVIQNFANTGEPAIIPPGKSIGSLMAERIRSARDFVPNFAAIPLNFSDDFAAIGASREEEHQFTLRELLRQALRGGYRGAAEDTAELFGVPGLTKDMLSAVKFSANARTSTLEDFLKHGPSPSPGITETNAIFQENLEKEAARIRRRSRLTGEKRAAYDSIPDNQIVSANKQGFLLEDAISKVYGIPQFSFNNARFDIRSALNANPEKMKRLLEDFKLPLSVRNVDLKRTVGDKRVSASFATKALFGSNLAGDQFEQVIDSLGLLGKEGLSPESIEKFKTIVRGGREVSLSRERESLSGRGQNKTRQNYLGESISGGQLSAASELEAFKLFAEGYVPNYAGRLSEDQLALVRRLSKRIADFPLEQRQQIINATAGGVYRFGPSEVPELRDFGLNLDLPAQVGAILAPRAYKDAVGHLRGSDGGIAIIDRTPNISTVAKKAFQAGDALFGDPVATGRTGRATPFTSSGDIERYLVENLNAEGLGRLAKRVQTVVNPAGRGNLKDGFDLQVALRDLPVVNIEKTALGDAYRRGVEARGLTSRNENKEFGAVVNDVVSSAVNRRVGGVRSKNAGIDLPAEFVKDILGIDLNYAPLGFDAKSSIDVEKNTIRSLLKKGNRERAGLDVFQSHLDDAIAAKGVSFEEQSVLSRLLRTSSNLFLRAKGYIPNLTSQISGTDALSSGVAESIGGLKDSISREIKGTGVSLSQVRVNFTDKKGVPGVSVTNTRDEGLRADPEIGFARVRNAGGNIFAAGSGREFAGGYVPNLVVTEADRRRIEEDIARQRRGANPFANVHEENLYRKAQYEFYGSKTTGERIAHEVRSRSAQYERDFGTVVDLGGRRAIEDHAKARFARELEESGLTERQAEQDRLRSTNERSIKRYSVADGYNSLSTGVSSPEQVAENVRTNVSTNRAITLEARRLKERTTEQRAAELRDANRNFYGPLQDTQLGAVGYREQLGVDGGIAQLPTESRRSQALPSGASSSRSPANASSETIAPPNGTESPSQAALREQERRLAAQERSRARIQHAGFALSFAAPLLAGGVASTLNDPRQQRQVEGVGSAIGTGAALGSFGGPLGITAGVVVAAVGVLKSIADNVKPSFEDLAKKTQDLAAKKKEEIDSVGNVLKAQASLQDAIKAGATPEQLRSVQTQYASSLNNVNDPATRARLLGASNDSERQQIFAELQQKANREVSASDALAASANIEEKFKTGIGEGNLLGFKKTSAKGYLFGTDARFADFGGASDNQKVNDESISAVRNLAAQVVQAGEDGEKLLPQIRERLSDELGQVFSVYYTTLSATNKAVQESTQSHFKYQVAVAGLNNIIARLTAQRIFSQGVQDSRDDANYSVKINRLRNTTELARPYLSEAAQSQITYDTGSLENQREYALRTRDVQSRLNSLFQESVTDPNIKDQQSLQQLQSDVQNRVKGPGDVGGNVEFKDFDRLATLQQQNTEQSVKINESLNALKLEQVKANDQFRAQKDILRDNYIFARRQAYATSQNNFLGTATLQNTDRSNSQAAAGAEQNILARELDERRNNTFSGALTNANQIFGYGGRGQVLQDRFRSVDADKIALAQDVKDQVAQGILPTLDATGYNSYKDLPSRDRQLIESSRRSLAEGISSNKYQDLENRANDRITPFLDDAGLTVGTRTRGIVEDALNSRDVGKVREAQGAIQDFRGSRSNVKEIGSLDIISSQLESFAKNLARIPEASNAQALKIVQGEDVPTVIRNQTAEIKTDNENTLKKFEELIGRANNIAANTNETNASVVRLGQLLDAQRKVTEVGQKLEDATKQRDSVRNDLDKNQNALNSDTIARIKLNSNVGETNANIRKSLNTLGLDSSDTDLNDVPRTILGGINGGKNFGNIAQETVDAISKDRSAQGRGALTNDQSTAYKASIEQYLRSTGILNSQESKDARLSIRKDQAALPALDSSISSLNKNFDSASDAASAFAKKMQEEVNNFNASQTKPTPTPSTPSTPFNPSTVTSSIIKAGQLAIAANPLPPALSSADIPADVRRDSSDPLQRLFSGIGPRSKQTADQVLDSAYDRYGDKINGAYGSAVDGKYHDPSSPEYKLGNLQLESRGVQSAIQNGNFGYAANRAAELQERIRGDIPTIERNGTSQQKEDYAQLVQVFQGLKESIDQHNATLQQTNNGQNSPTGTTTVNIPVDVKVSGGSIDYADVMAKFQSALYAAQVKIAQLTNTQTPMPPGLPSSPSQQ